MNRSKQLLVGSFLLLCVALLGWTLTFENLNLSDHLPTILGIVLFIMLGIALLVPWGRPFVPRVAMGIASLVMVGLAVWMMLEVDRRWDVAILAVCVVGGCLTGLYAITGYYEKEWPFGEVFSTTSLNPPPSSHQQE